MATARFRGGDMSLEEIERDLENPELTPTQRRQAFEDLRKWLREHPDDGSARRLWQRHEEEFGREPSEVAGESRGGGFGAVSEAEREARGDASGRP